MMLTMSAVAMDLPAEEPSFLLLWVLVLMIDLSFSFDKTF
jgi:hypothetical protein